VLLRVPHGLFMPGCAILPKDTEKAKEMTSNEPQQDIQPRPIQVIIPALDYLHEIFATCDFLSDEECVACALTND
jgi:hypothetical protein